MKEGLKLVKGSYCDACAETTEVSIVVIAWLPTCVLWSGRHSGRLWRGRCVRRSGDGGDGQGRVW